MRYTDTHQSRKELRTIVFEFSDARCEHPIMGPDGKKLIPCQAPAMELAHIYPRGMGHNGYRDSLSNVIAACTYHARSTDDLSNEVWVEIGLDRIGLTEWVRKSRSRQGWEI